MKAVFLDKEGALDGAGEARFTLSSGAGPALRLLSRLDYRLFVVSAQGAIASTAARTILDDTKGGCAWF